MDSRIMRLITGIFGGVFLVLSLIFALRSYQQFKTSQSLPAYPAGMTIASLPVGGLDRTAALARLKLVYDLPVEMRCQTSLIQMPVQSLGFLPDYETTLNNAETALSRANFWQFLWQKSPQNLPAQIPLVYSIDENAIRNFLTNEIVPRYQQGASGAYPLADRPEFVPAVDGISLQMDAAVAQISSAMQSAINRRAELPFSTEAAPPLPAEYLSFLLKQITQQSGFNGLVEIYLKDLQNGLNLHLALRNNQEIAPDVAYTAASTIKIPIMISAMHHTAEPLPDDTLALMKRMIDLSENPPADDLMRLLDDARGPIIVTEDMQALGLQNTFLAGYFAVGAPVLQLYTTPANSRTDIDLDPDVYNQTVPSEIGRLLEGIYHCAKNNQGLLVDTFGAAISQNKCQTMYQILDSNEISLYFESSLPPQASVAHKHGWVQDLDGIFRSTSDVGIISTPGGDYVLVVFLHHPNQLFFDDANLLITKLSWAVYNAFNTQDQYHYWLAK